MLGLQEIQRIGEAIGGVRRAPPRQATRVAVGHVPQRRGVRSGPFWVGQLLGDHLSQQKIHSNDETRNCKDPLQKGQRICTIHEREWNKA